QLLCLTADFARGVAEIYCHGQRLARLEKPDGLKVMPKGLFQLGGGRVAYTNCAGSCMSDIAEVLIFRRALLAEERRLIEMYLQKRWGLASLADITTLAMLLPFAYYPSTGEIELAFDKDAPLLKEYFASCHRTPDNQAVNLSPGLSWATWKERSDPQKEKPERTGTVTTLDLPGPTFDPPANTPYAIAGWLDIPKDGVYTFMLRPQSASALCIADKLVADQSQSKNTWGTWNWRGDAIALKAGKHRFFLKGEAQPRRIEHEKIPLVIWCGPDFLRQGALP
ncbi:MAG: hypothetical protein N3A66_10995, partial [Planctomycetota bacterium]|nr:hypothetical protein [Planctomycetota bacterium]